ncbi:MAG: LacI family DNA-binding transcriptional regulator [Anaerolineae bacterium]|nr:LacI family transcriptional regulator [Anaerolineae bacterium]MDW8067473.1 LacI family DNA-binding transcriptional regulator [Anaerolineae bacterium]
MPPTLEEVAKLAGVSRSTVSRVINQQPNVRPEVRERVWEVIRQTGYQPHAAARSLATRRTRVIGLVIPQAVTTLFTDPYFPIFMRGVADACNAHNYHLMLSLFSHRRAQGAPTSQDALYQQILRSRYLDGVVVSSATLDDPVFHHLLEDGVPFVIAGRYPHERANYVDVDNVVGARMAVEHLLRLGHERIATITGPLNMFAAQDRLEGYRQALTARGIPIDEHLIVEGDFTEQGGQAAMKRLLPYRPTAVFAASDMMAIGALKALREDGLRVPEDIALVGFDDVPLASMVDPALTTVRQPIEQLGSMAVELLISLLENPQRETVHRVVLPTELVIRASCGVRVR